MKTFIVLLSCFMLLALTSSGNAQIKPSTFSLTPYIGGYTFEGNQHLKTRPVYGLRAGYDFTRNLGVEALFGYVSTDYNGSDAGGTQGTKVYNYRLEGLYHLMPASKLVPFVSAGVGGQRVLYPAGVSDKTRAAFSYGAGLKYFLTERVALRADVRHVLVFDSIYNNLEYTLGLGFVFGAPKPVPIPVPAKEVRDSDGDGVPDDLDKCPDTPKGVIVDKDGCPLDSDNDGVPDYLDKCPDTPKGVIVDKDGCPLDSDNDGVPDYLDKCPDTPKGVQVDENGCPPPAPVTAQKAAAAMTETEAQMLEKGRVTLNVEFDTGKTLVKPRYNKEIEKVAEVMKKYPELKVVIEGHTDNIGGAKYNQNLSQRRAEAIKNVMVKKYKIEASRLTAKGFGFSKPIADNKTKEGKQKNRRVEAATDYVIKK